MTGTDQGSGKIILASGSPRRRRLLEQIGIAFEVIPAEIDESLRSGELPSDYTSRIAREKVEAVVLRHGKAQIVLGADTTVVLGDQILGKPESEDHAIEMLRSLSDKLHHVFTAVAVAGADGHIEQALNVTEVEFASLDDSWIRAYVASGEPMDKAGAYGIQGWAAPRIRRVNGSYSSVMGLPLHETAVLLECAGLILRPGG